MKRLLIAGILLLATCGASYGAGCSGCVTPVAPDTLLARCDAAPEGFMQEFVGWIAETDTFYPLISPSDLEVYEKMLPDSGGGDSKYLIDQINCLVKHARVDIITGNATVYAIPPMWYPWADTTHFGRTIDDSKAALYSASYDGLIYGLRVSTTAESIKVAVTFWN